MKYLQKIGIRIFISLFGGGFVQEIIHVFTGDPNRPTRTNLSLFYAVIIYIILTFIVKKKNNTL